MLTHFGPLIPLLVKLVIRFKPYLQEVIFLEGLFFTSVIVWFLNL
jgi:hypothetical protein